MPYFDHNATTPLDPRVLDTMLPHFADQHGNPSSAHRWGRDARTAVEAARDQVARLLGARPEDVLFTGSGTEANNTVIAAVAAHHDHQGRLLISAFEHPSVNAAAARAEAAGMTIDVVRPRADGVVAANDVEAHLHENTRLVVLMLANNELGTVQPLADVARRCRARGIPVLTDAVQAIGKMAVDAPGLGIDYLTLGGHKFHGPFGAAALWVRSGAVFDSLLVGAAHESGRRASTENVPAVVGLGHACTLAARELDERRRHLAFLRDHFETGLGAIDGSAIHCREALRLPHTSHVAIRGHLAQNVMMALDEAGFAVSTGAACGAGAPQPSPAAVAMGLDDDEALSSLRISFGMTNTEAEVDALLDALARIVD